MRKLLLFVITLYYLLNAQDFTLHTEFPQKLYYGAADWGDYDNDGDLDLFTCGDSYELGYHFLATVYRNDNGIFNLTYELEECVYPTGKWADLNNDGYLDLIVGGLYPDGYFTKIYYSDNGNMGSYSTEFDFAGGSIDCGDFDNDGDIDILSGSLIYLNDDGKFIYYDSGIKKVETFYSTACSFSDYDCDGDLDVLVTGGSFEGGNLAKNSIVYRNDNGIFTDIEAGLEPLRNSCVAWGDYDNDGDPDILMAGDFGWGDGSFCTLIYRNDNGTFTNTNAGLESFSRGKVAWSDFDNDGDLDILTSGSLDLGFNFTTKLYINNSGIFSYADRGLDDYGRCSFACGDYDNDGDTDIYIQGYIYGIGVVSKLYKNDISLSTPNFSPSAPLNLSHTIDGPNMNFSWDRSTDNVTPQSGLSYNLFIGSQTLSTDVCTPMSDTGNGYRKIVNFGNCGQANSRTVKNFAAGTYYWSVQAVDHSYSGSAFSAEQSFTINPSVPEAPVASFSNIQDYGFTAEWNSVDGANEYRLDVSADSTFSTFVEGYVNFFLHPDLVSYEVQGLEAASMYYFRLRAFNGEYSPFSNIVSVLTADKRFVEVSHPLTDVEFSDWGDYDNDGDMDILAENYILINDLGLFNRSVKYRGYPLSSTPSFGDYDNDGDLDILYGNELFENNGGSYSLKTSFWEITFDSGYDQLDYQKGTAYWYDIDNDSYPDIFLSAIYDWYWYEEDPYYPPVHFALDETFIYKNNGDGTFSASSLGNGSNQNLSFADYDNDGDMDFYSANTSKNIFRNDSGSLTAVNVGIENTTSSSDWGDYDNDGDPDLIQTGRWFVSGVGYSMETQLYRNDGVSFTRIPVEIPGAYESSIKWGDYDNDGDLDILLTGRFEYYEGGTRIYRNDSGVFTDINAGLNDSYGEYIKAMWCDYDNDNDLDLFSGQFIYRNDTDPGKIILSKSPNTPPQPPTSLSSSVDGCNVLLNWDKSTDTETPQDGLSYSIYIGTTSGTGNKLNPESDIFTGYRKIVTPGNAGQTGSKSIRLTNGTYYWGVQAVDNGYAGSNFSSEETFTISVPLPVAPAATDASNINSISFRANWNSSINTTGYYLDVATDSLFSTYLTGFNNKNVGNVLYFNITGLSNSKAYYYRVRSYNSVGTSDNSNIVKALTSELLPPVVQAASNIGDTSFTANWYRSSDASGSYLDVASDSMFTQYVTGFQNKNVGSVQSYNITGLSPDIFYYYRLRSYIGGVTSVNSNTVSVLTIAVEFSDEDTNIPYAVNGSLAYGDYDNDGDIDLLMAGSGNTVVYRNDVDMFRKTYLNLPGISGYDSSVSWGDYDNDGYLDILITGWIPGDTFGESISRVYRNNGDGTFTNINAGLIGMRDGCGIWCDYDNDGDKDIFLSGPSAENICIYRNDEGSFTIIDSGLHHSVNCSMASFDYDNDGYQDLVVCGYAEDFAMWDFDNIEEITKIYRNNADGTFSDSGITLKGLAKGKVSPGDYNNDGFTDLLITGVDTSWGPIDWEEYYLYDLSYAYVYRNNGNGTFTNINAGLTGVEGSAVWYDNDNDGDLDIFISGLYCYRDYSAGLYDLYYKKEPENALYINNGGSFTKNFFDNTIIENVIAGDHDNDGDTDIFITGEYGSKFFKNNSVTPNILPSTPSNLSAIQSADNSLTFSWDKATDAQTLQNGLSYNLYLGTESTTGNSFNPMSDITSGYRRVVELGNAQQNTSWTIKDLAAGTYYWSVQAIDHSYAGSLFAPEQNIIVTGIEENIPLTTELYQNYPNPFNPATEIKFSLAEDAKVNLSVYNTNGQIVKTLVDGKKGKGFHTIQFNCEDMNSGMYLYTLDVKGKVQTRKMIMLK